MSKGFKIALLLFAVILVVGSVALLKLRKSQLSSTPPPEKPLYVVRGATVKEGTLEVKRRFLGFLKSVNTVQVSTKSAGYIKKLFVDTGYRVRRGQPLVLIDDTPVRTQLQSLLLEIENLKLQLNTLRSKKSALEVELLNRKRNYERSRRLFEKKAVPKETLERSYALFKLAQAQYEEVLTNIKVVRNKLRQLRQKRKSLERELDYLNIKAPVDGIIQAVHLREGNLATPGKPILTLESSKGYELVVKLPLDFPVSVGDRVFIKTEGSLKEFEIEEILPSASPENLKVAKVNLPQKPKGTLSNSRTEVFLVKEVKGFVVPVNSLLFAKDKAYLLLYEDGSFKKVEVELKGTDGGLAVVEGRLKEGMKVAVAQQSKLRLLALSGKGKLLLKEMEK
ncbi:MAG: efflux RND transporter periplasmic adaptor subunit [Aquificae bacterium]|nr:efflux RND transporter periplasmic adaptor subunit [Aquificota bacterium]